MSGANWAYCPVCDRKALHVGDADVPDDVVVLHEACRAQSLAEAVQAERERIRLRVLGCTVCGKVHECRDQDPAGARHTWASADDGHAYRARWRVAGYDTSTHTAVEALTGDAP